VLVSIRAFSKSKLTAGFGQINGEDEDAYVDRFIATVGSCLDDIAATPPAVDHITLRYEDFSRDMNACAAQLGSWLDVELDADFVDQAAEYIPAHRTTRSIEESIGRWRHEL
jgi:hypothetical protein